MHEISKRLCEVCFRSILLHHLFGSLQDPAHLAAAEELLSLARLLAPKQQHVVSCPHLSLREMSYLYSEWSCESVSCESLLVALGSKPVTKYVLFSSSLMVVQRYVSGSFGLDWGMRSSNCPRSSELK